MKKHLVRCIMPSCRRYYVHGHLRKTPWQRTTAFRLKVLRLWYGICTYEICPQHIKFGPIFWEKEEAA